MRAGYPFPTPLNQLQNNKYIQVTPPAAIVDNAAVATNEIDRIGFNKLIILVCLGALDIAVPVLKLQESDTTGAGFADVPNGAFGTAAAPLPTATDDNKLFAFHVDLIGRKRFIDLSLTAGDGAAGTFVSVLAILSDGSISPNDAASRGLAVELFV